MLSEQGFLSTSVSDIIKKIHIDNAQWFDLVESINKLGMRVLSSANPVQSSNQQLVAAALFGRILTSFQAANVLVERGMVADARTVIRAAVESVIVLSALEKDEKVCDKLIERHQWHYRKLRNSWVAGPDSRAALTKQEIDAIEAAILESDKENPNIKNIKDPIKLEALAREAGVIGLYDVVYRTTSGDSAHTSIGALDRHIRSNSSGEIIGLQFGPEFREIPQTLSDAIATLAHALNVMPKMFSLSQYESELTQYIGSWKSLVKEMSSYKTS